MDLRRQQQPHQRAVRQQCLSYTIDSGNNRLLKVAGPAIKTYTHDAAGNPLNDGIAAYNWNSAGRLSQVVRNGKTYQFRHNGLGERVDKAENLNTNGRHFFVYDTAGQLIGEYRENLATPQTDDWLLTQETVWLDDMPVAAIKQASPTDPIQVYYIHADHLNTPRVIVDATNTPVWKWNNQNAFGDNPPNEDPDGDSNLFEYNLRFAGQYFDTETKLHYNYFRDYDPQTGRYLSSDPIGLAGGLNTYGYALQNPLTYTDPDGLAPDAIADLTLIGADLISYAYNKYRGCDTSVDEASLAANVTGLFVPGATGLGLGVRAVGKATKGTPKSPGINPKDIANKMPAQIDKLAKDKGLIPKGSNPRSGKGAYVDPVTGKQRVLCHPNCSDPHAHVNNQQGQRLDINGNVVPPESPAAHLPIKLP